MTNIHSFPIEGGRPRRSAATQASLNVAALFASSDSPVDARIRRSKPDKDGDFAMAVDQESSSDSDDSGARVARARGRPKKARAASSSDDDVSSSDDDDEAATSIGRRRRKRNNSKKNKKQKPNPKRRQKEKQKAAEDSSDSEGEPTLVNGTHFRHLREYDRNAPKGIAMYDGNNGVWEKAAQVPVPWKVFENGLKTDDIRPIPATILQIAKPNGQDYKGFIIEREDIQYFSGRDGWNYSVEECTYYSHKINTNMLERYPNLLEAEDWLGPPVRFKKWTKAKEETWTKVGRKVLRLSPSRGMYGYSRQFLSVEKNVRVEVACHRIVGTVWLDPPPSDGKKYVVNHKNSCRTDNRAENLEWITQAENSMKKNQDSDTFYETSFTVYAPSWASTADYCYTNPLYPEWAACEEGWLAKNGVPIENIAASIDHHSLYVNYRINVRQGLSMSFSKFLYQCFAFSDLQNMRNVENHIAKMMKGKVVDHVSGNRKLNAIWNLRLVSFTENARNCGLCVSNISEVNGIHRSSCDRYWVSSYPGPHVGKLKRRKRIYRYFKSFQEAVEHQEEYGVRTNGNRKSKKCAMRLSAARKAQGGD